MRVQFSLGVSVKKRATDYEQSLGVVQSVAKAGPGPCHKTAVKQPANGASVPRKPQSSSYPTRESVTRATARVTSTTTFRAYPRVRQVDEKPTQEEELTCDENDDCLSVLGYLILLVFVICPVLIAANRTINTTVNVLPMTLNLASPGLVVGAFLLVAMVVDHFKPRASLVHRGTQTERLGQPEQETLYPTQCTDPAKGYSHDNPNSDEDIRTQVLLAIQKVTEV